MGVDALELGKRSLGRDHPTEGGRVRWPLLVQWLDIIGGVREWSTRAVFPLD